jgi:hopanoid biosynthesis associated RND transporter like protein HpnN
MSSGEKPSLAIRLLTWLAGALVRRPGWFLWPQVVLFLACVAFTVFQLEFDMDRNSLVGEDKPSHRNFLAMQREFPSQDDIVVVVESDDTEKNRQVVERLGARLEAESVSRNPTNVFGDVFFKGDLRLMGKKALLFFPETNLVEFSKALADYRPFMDQFMGSTNMASLFRQVNFLIRTSGRERSERTESFVKALPAMERLLRMATDSLSRPGNPPSPGVEALFGGGAEAERAKYITLGNGRIYLVSAKPPLVQVTAADVKPSLWEQIWGRPADATPKRIEETRSSRQGSANQAAIRRIRELVVEVSAEVPGVNMGVTGESVLALDEMNQSEKDSTVATLLSLVICAVIFVVGYRQTGRPLKAMLCLVIGLGYTMGYTTLVVGHLNILTITFAPMLIGLAIDFGVHLVTRYEEELRHGRTEQDSMFKAVVYTGQGIFTGCFTTAGAFLAMSLTDFRGIQEMGVISGGGLLLCLVPMITVLPVLLLRGRQNRIDEVAGARQVREDARVSFEAGAEPVEPVDARARLERMWLDRPWTVIGVVAALCVIAAVRLPSVRFDYNLLNMQSAGLPAVVFEHKLIGSSEKSVLFGALVADSLEHAAELEAKVRALPSVSSTDSMARYLSEDQRVKLELVRSARSNLAGLKFAPLDPGPVDLTELSQRLWAFAGYMGLASDEVVKLKDPELASRLKSIGAAAREMRVAMFRGNREANAIKLGAFQRAFLGDVQETLMAIRDQDDSGPLRVEDLPAQLRNRFVGKTGKHLVQVYPKYDVWSREEQATFVRELRTIDPKVTGTPVQLYEYTSLLKNSYVEAAWWALGAIVILVFIHFRSLGPVLLSLLPVAIGTLWMVGFMGWTGIPFNPANIMTLPLVIGIGVTNGIHILNRFAEEKNPSILAKSTGKAVLVSGLTTIAGFGSLIVGEHQGIQSLGWIMAVGTATCMTAGLTFLPAVLTLRARGKTGT